MVQIPPSNEEIVKSEEVDDTLGTDKKESRSKRDATVAINPQMRASGNDSVEMTTISPMVQQLDSKIKEKGKKEEEHV